MSFTGAGSFRQEQDEKTGEILESAKIRAFIDFDEAAGYRKNRYMGHPKKTEGFRNHQAESGYLLEQWPECQSDPGRS